MCVLLCGKLKVESFEIGRNVVGSPYENIHRTNVNRPRLHLAQLKCLTLVHPSPLRITCQFYCRELVIVRRPTIENMKKKKSEINHEKIYKQKQSSVGQYSHEKMRTRTPNAFHLFFIITYYYLWNERDVQSTRSYVWRVCIIEITAAWPRPPPPPSSSHVNRISEHMHLIQRMCQRK